MKYLPQFKHSYIAQQMHYLLFGLENKTNRLTYSLSLEQMYYLLSTPENKWSGFLFLRMEAVSLSRSGCSALSASAFFVP